MLLSTLECAQVGCLERLYEDADMWHAIEHAKDLGWTVSHSEEFAWCPQHSPESGVIEHWVVGCYTCDFEEEYESEEEAKNEHRMHECEPDTWIWSPEKVREVEAKRAAKRTVQTARVNATLSEAAARQDQLERYAASWLRLRNFFLFWKKNTMEGTEP